MSGGSSPFHRAPKRCPAPLRYSREADSMDGTRPLQPVGRGPRGPKPTECLRQRPRVSSLLCPLVLLGFDEFLAFAPWLSCKTTRLRSSSSVLRVASETTSK